MPTKASLRQFVVHERQRGVRAMTVNTYIGAMNAFCVWLALETAKFVAEILQGGPQTGT